jgi:hypothetical protein
VRGQRLFLVIAALVSLSLVAIAAALGSAQAKKKIDVKLTATAASPVAAGDTATYKLSVWVPKQAKKLKFVRIHPKLPPGTDAAKWYSPTHRKIKRKLGWLDFSAKAGSWTPLWAIVTFTPAASGEQRLSASVQVVSPWIDLHPKNNSAGATVTVSGAPSATPTTTTSTTTTTASSSTTTQPSSSSTTTTTQPSSSSTTTTTTPAATADLAIALQGTQAPGAYNVTVTNNGPSATPSFTVTYACTNLSSNCPATWSGGALQPGASATNSFSVTKSPNTPPGQQATVRATVSGPVADPNANNNSAQASF